MNLKISNEIANKYLKIGMFAKDFCSTPKSEQFLFQEGLKKIRKYLQQLFFSFLFFSSVLSFSLCENGKFWCVAKGVGDKDDRKRGADREGVRM